MNFLILAVILIAYQPERQTKLPEFQIFSDSISWYEKKPCEVRYSDCGREWEEYAEIKYRGGMSSRYYKHSFFLETSDKHAPANLPPDDDWILNANYIDKTFMRHKISYDLFRQMSPENVASKCAYVNVYLNDDYKGLYVLMEEINAGLLGLDRGDSLAMLFKDPAIFYEGRTHSVQDTANYYQQKFPKIGTSDKTRYIERFKDFLFHSADDEFVRGISERVDLGNVIDWHLILLLTNNSDGIMKNFYLYKENAESPFRFAIWDYDHSFGRDGDNEMNMMERELDVKRAVLLKRLMEIPGSGYPEMLKGRWNELREEGVFTTENFSRMIAENDEVIAPALERNFEKWPVDGKWYYDDNGYDEEVALMKDFVELRIGQLDVYFEGL